MPNLKKHLIVGAAVGATVFILYDVVKQRVEISEGTKLEINWGELVGNTLTGAVLGAVGGVLPDILEPALNPHHRKTFHSFTSAVVLAKLLHSLELTNCAPELKASLRAGGSGYLSHLILDMTTPMSLPII